MNYLSKGQFYGRTNDTICLNGVTLTDTEYTHDKVDWHYHENPYFTFILQGHLVEGNKKEIYNCSPGTLLFHNWQEPHFNNKPNGYARGFHIEVEQSWTDNFAVDLKNLQGSIHVSNPDLKLLLYRIFKEIKLSDDTTPLSVEDLLLQALAGMQYTRETLLKNKPLWVKKIKEILHDRCSDKLSLMELAHLVNIHPVHLCRDFSKYFKCSLGDYVRQLKIVKSLSLLVNSKKSLTHITFECGFSDQSHFIRHFKAMTGVSPMVYRKILID